MAELPKVKGIMYGKYSAYLTQHINPDMLYWITDKGLLIRGETIVTPTKFIDITPPEDGHNAYTFTIEAYENDPTQPVQYSFEVYTRSAVITLIQGLQSAINAHKNTTATDMVLGHVKLSDATDSDLDAATGGHAATPLAVKNALAAAIAYVNTQIAGLSGGLTFKGTYGLQADNPDEYAPLDEIAAARGDMYICISTMTDVDYHDGEGNAAIININPGDDIICVQAAVESGGTITTQARWTIVAGTSSNAVTTNETLDDGAVIVGNGGKTVRKLTGGSTGYFLRKTANGGGQWQPHVNLDHGIAYADCVTQFDEPNKTVEISGYKAQDYSIIAVRFFNGVSERDTLSVTDGQANLVRDTPIIYHGDYITKGIIEKGDTATFMLVPHYEIDDVEIAVWVLISIDRAPNNTPTNLSAFTNDIQALLLCTTAGNSKTITNSSVHIKAGSVFAVRFNNAVGAGSTLNINNGGAKPIKHRNAAIGDSQIRATDTATFIFDGTAYHVLAIDRAFDTAPTAGHHSLVDSDAIYNFVMSQVNEATLYWQEMQ